MGIGRKDVEIFVARYEYLFNRAVNGDADLDAIKMLYSAEFIAATPQGVRSGVIDDSFEAVMARRYERYRALGTKSMTVEKIDIHEIDGTHCVARVSWESVYQRGGGNEIHIPFDVNYLLEQRGGDLKVFGWIVGDEDALLKAKGVV